MASNTAGSDKNANCPASNVIPPCTTSTGKAEYNTPTPMDEAKATDATPSNTAFSNSTLGSPSVPSRIEPTMVIAPVK